MFKRKKDKEESRERPDVLKTILSEEPMDPPRDASDILKRKVPVDSDRYGHEKELEKKEQPLPGNNGSQPSQSQSQVNPVAAKTNPQGVESPFESVDEVVSESLVGISLRQDIEQQIASRKSQPAPKDPPTQLPVGANPGMLREDPDVRPSKAPPWESIRAALTATVELPPVLRQNLAEPGLEVFQAEADRAADIIKRCDDEIAECHARIKAAERDKEEQQIRIKFINILTQTSEALVEFDENGTLPPAMLKPPEPVGATLISRISPAVRKKMAENDISEEDLEGVKGTGKHGAFKLRDLDPIIASKGVAEV